MNISSPMIRSLKISKEKQMYLEEGSEIRGRFLEHERVIIDDLLTCMCLPNVNRNENDKLKKDFCSNDSRYLINTSRLFLALFFRINNLFSTDIPSRVSLISRLSFFSLSLCRKNTRAREREGKISSLGLFLN